MTTSTNRSKTLVILSPGFAASEADTICLPMQQALVRALNKIHPELSVIVLSFQYPYRQHIYQWFENTIISFDGKNRGGLHRLLLRRRIMKALKKIHHDNKVIGLLSFWYGECAWVGKRFGHQYSIPHRCWILGQDARPGNKYPRRSSLPSGDLLALSDFLRSEFQKNYATRPFTVLTPGVDTERINTLSRPRDIDLLAAGSLIPLKQYPVFLDIIAGIKKKMPSIKAVIIGDGPEREHLATLILGSGLQNEVVLTGELPYNEVLQYMQRARVFLHPSSYEGFSGVCLEAISAGAQVISFCRPMEQHIKHWQIATTGNEMLKMAIAILNDPSTDHSPVRDFEIKNTAKKILSLFE